MKKAENRTKMAGAAVAAMASSISAYEKPSAKKKNGRKKKKKATAWTRHQRAAVGGVAKIRAAP